MSPARRATELDLRLDEHDPARRRAPTRTDRPQHGSAIEREQVPQGLPVVGEDGPVVVAARQHEDNDSGSRVVANLQADPALERLRISNVRLTLGEEGAIRALDDRIPRAEVTLEW